MTNVMGVSEISIKAWASPRRLRLDRGRIQNDVQFISPHDLQYEQKGAAFLTRYLAEHLNDHVVVDSQSYTNALLELETPHRDRVHVLEYVPFMMTLDDFSRKVSGTVS